MYSPLKDLCQKELSEFVGHKDEVNCVSFASDFSFMVTGSDDQRVHVFNVKTKQCVVRLKGHEGAVKGVSISPCDQYFASGSFDKTARIWKTADGSCLHVLKGHTKSVEVVAFSSYSVYLCTGSWDRTAILWCVQTGCHIRTFSGHGSLVQSVAFSFTHELLASGSWDFTIRIWTLNHMKNMKIVDTFVKSKKASVDNTMEDAILKEEMIQNYGINIESSECQKEENDSTSDKGDCREKDNVNESKDDTYYYVNNNGNVNHSDKEHESEEIKGNNIMSEAENDHQNVKGVDSMKDEENDVKNVKDSDVISNRGVHKQNHKGNDEMQDNEIDTQNYNESTNKEIAATDNSGVEDADADHFSVLTGHTGNVHAVAFSKLGMLASGSWDRSVRVWNPMKGNCLHILLGHTGWVQAVNFSPDATYCASAADDESVKVWDIVTGECVNTLEGCTYLAHHCAFTLNGHLIASGAAAPPVERQQKKADGEKTQLAEEQLKAMLHPW